MEFTDIKKIGFIKQNSSLYNIWNEVTDVKVEDDVYKEALILNLSIKISDLDLLLDIENKDFLFVENEAKEIFYVPIVQYEEKVIYKKDWQNPIEELKISLIVLKELILNEKFIFLNKKQIVLQNNFEELNILEKTINPNVEKVLIFNKSVVNRNNQKYQTKILTIQNKEIKIA